MPSVGFCLIAPSSFIVIFKPLVVLSTFTVPRVDVNVRFDFIESKSSGVIFAFAAVTSTLIGCVVICGSYFVAWVKTLKTTRDLFVALLVLLSSTIVAASFATTKRVTLSSSVHFVFPVLYSPNLPEIVMFLGASNSTLLLRTASL